MAIKSIDEAVKAFEDAAIIHDKSNRNGDFKTGNKAATQIRIALKYIWNNNPYILSSCLDHTNDNVKVWAAMFWLEINEKHALKVLRAFSETESFYRTSAKYSIVEWKKGNLTSDQWEN